MFIQDSKPPVSEGIWAKGDGRKAEEGPGGILHFPWLPMNVFIRQAADGWHLSKGAVSTP